ncbi:hypothetical protein MhomT_16045 [Microbacterium hominis]|nr:hypothetical protein MhomT_16045 [Microbacterium hominis]
MTPDGTLVYGVWVGFAETLQSGPGYNDGAWHHVVATQGSEGMRLYVDGVLKGSNTQSNAQDYTGYWHVGGDVTWGPGDWEFDGRIDEVAVYAAPLAASDVAQHHALGATGAAANLPPTASFTSSVTKLAVAVDGSGSTDADGTVAGYGWSWGDGTPDGAGATATHTYAAAGTYTVTLTVTDDKGVTATSSAPVVAVANQAPSASFTSTATDLTVAVDAGGSTDGDGHVTGYAWNWGDGSPAGSGVTATHAYTTAGSYTITLTVTDDDGATATQAIPVTVTAPVVGATYANDSFNRAVAAGLGTADNGGAWTLSNTASNYRVDGTKAVFIQPSATSQRYAYLTGVSSTDTAVDVDVTLPQRPVGGSAYVTVHSRRVGTAEYKARLVVAPSGGLTVQLQQTGVTLANVGTALTVAAGDTLHVRTEAVGTSPTTLRVKVWKVGTAEPTAWTATATDATAALQAPGAVGLGVYLGGGVTTVPFETRFDNFWAGSSAGAAPVNQAPTAAFTSTPSGLSVAVDGSGSSDPDGAVTAFAWDFGDGATGTGATASHAYVAAGTYTVKLTVTDDKGATGTTTNPVTVTAPAAAPFAVDAFERTSGTVLGAATTGGTWTQTSGTANVAIDAGAAKLTTQAAGQTRSATLNAATSTSTDLTFGFSLSAVPTGARMYVSALGRVVGSDDYRARWVIAPGGAVQAQLARGGTVLASLDLPGFTVSAGTVYSVRVQVDGTGTTALRSKIWPAGTAEPAAWQLSTTDTTAALQTAGFPGFTTYAGTGFTALPSAVRFDDFQAKAVTP